MSTSLLYHSFGLKGVRYKATRYQAGKIIFEAEMTRKLEVCPQCQSRKVTKEGNRIRLLHLPPIGLKPTQLRLKVYRLNCKFCGAIRWPELPFSGQKNALPSPLPD